MEHLLKVLLEALEAFCCCAEGVDILTERKPSICLPDACVFFAIELS